MVEGGAQRKRRSGVHRRSSGVKKSSHRRVGRPSSRRTVHKRSSRRRVGGASHKRSSRRKVGGSSHRRRSTRGGSRHKSGLSSKTVMQLRKMARSAGVRQSRKGHLFKKSALIRALSGKSKSSRRSSRRSVHHRR